MNAIDKLLAREEAHHLTDYRICLKQILSALRAINPFQDPYDMPAQNYIDFYNAMAGSKKGDHSVRGWNYSAYDDPAFFIYLLRRHAVTTAFSHPKYAGNVGAAGWAFLSERFVDRETKETLFDWRPALARTVRCSFWIKVHSLNPTIRSRASAAISAATRCSPRGRKKS